MANASHLAAASQVLAGFAAAVPLEELNSHGASWLQAALGWRGAPRKTNAHRTACGAPPSAGAHETAATSGASTAMVMVGTVRDAVGPTTRSGSMAEP